MFISVFVDLLKIVAQLVGIFSARSALAREYERLVKSAISSWEKRVDQSGKLRKDHRSVDEELERKFDERWRRGSSDIPARDESGDGKPQPNSIELILPSTATRYVPFRVDVVNCPPLSELWRDDKFKLMTVTGTSYYQLTFNTPGRAMLSIKHEGRTLATAEIEVKE